jgi:8-amino-7-oxononanoate synthase
MAEIQKENLTNEDKKALLKKLIRNKKKQSAKYGNSEKNTNTIPEQFWKIDAFSEIREFDEQYSLLDKLQISNPFFRVNQGIIKDTTVIENKTLISYSSYNYLGLSGDPQVSETAKNLIDEYGTSVSASRMITGEKPIHYELEKGIADFLGVDNSVVFVSGHATNVTTIGHLFGPKDLVIHDSLAHNSIVQGALLARARRIAFPHNDYAALEEILEEDRMEYEKVLIAVEGVYSVDGDLCDLNRLIEIKKKYKAILLVDEAHSIGILGKTGRGIGEHCGINPKDVEMWMGTLSKTFASCGGYIAGSEALTHYLKCTAPGFMFSVGISPPNVGSALASLNILKKEPQRVKKLQDNADFFRKKAKELGLDIGLSHDSAVIPVIVGNTLDCIKMTNILFENGINVQPILYPAVAEDEARLRFFITTDHKKEQMEYTLEKTEKALKELGVRS